MTFKSTVALIAALAFSIMPTALRAQNTPEELLRKFNSMGAVKAGYEYTQSSPEEPSVTVTGDCYIEGDMWRVNCSDGSEFYSDGKVLWYKTAGEVNIYDVDPESADPMRNIKSFILKSTLSHNSAGNVVLTKKQKNGFTIVLEIKSMMKVPLKGKPYYSLDVSSLGDEWYVTDLRRK